MTRWGALGGCFADEVGGVVALTFQAVFSKKWPQPALLAGI